VPIDVPLVHVMVNDVESLPRVEQQHTITDRKDALADHLDAATQSNTEFARHRYADGRAVDPNPLDTGDWRMQRPEFVSASQWLQEFAIVVVDAAVFAHVSCEQSDGNGPLDVRVYGRDSRLPNGDEDLFAVKRRLGEGSRERCGRLIEQPRRYALRCEFIEEHARVEGWPRGDANVGG
jgi:hypothetical protein